jgi:hypothetical protein
LGEPPKSAKSGFSPPAKNPHRVPRRAPGGGRRGSGRGTVPSGLLSDAQGPVGGGKKIGKSRKNGRKTAFFDDGSKNQRRHRSKRRPTDAAGGDRRVGAIGVDRGPSGEKWVRKTEGKSRKFDDSGATFGTVGGPVAVDAERRNSAVGRGDASATTSVKFRPDRKSGSDAGDVARDHPSGEATEKGRSTRAARRRTRRRRGTDARNSRQYGERRVGETEQKKIAKIGEGVRKLSTIWRASKSGFVRRRPHARVTTATRSGIGRRRSSRQPATALAQWAERRSMVPEVSGSIPRTDFSFFYCSRGVRRKRNLANASTITRSRRRPSIRVRCMKLNTRLAATDGKAVLQRVAANARRRRRRREKSNRK